jgi:hypothetical protein
MSYALRPVKEIWSRNFTSCFLTATEVVEVMNYLAELAGTSASEYDYGELVSLWIMDSKKFLNFIRPHDFKLRRKIRNHFKGVLDLSLLDSLLDNMRALVPAWRKFLGAANEDGLTLYIDAD